MNHQQLLSSLANILNTPKKPDADWGWQFAKCVSINYIAGGGRATVAMV